MQQPPAHLDARANMTQVIRDALRGSEAAYALIYRCYAGLVHSILLGRFRPAVADELTQECFATAFRKLDQLKDGEKFGSWIAAIARRVEPGTSSVEAVTDVLPTMASSAASHEDQSEAENILRAIKQLPEAYRETLMLRLVEGCGGAEIAALTGLTAESVRVNLHRGMQKLRDALAMPAARQANREK